MEAGSSRATVSVGRRLDCSRRATAHEQTIGRERPQAVADHVEPVEAERQKRERRIRTALLPLDRTLDEVEEEQAVGQARQRVRQLGLGDVGQRASEPGGRASRVPDRRSTAEHPSDTCRCDEASGARSRSACVPSSRCVVSAPLTRCDIFGVHPVEPLVGADTDLLLIVTEHGFPAGRPVGLVAEQIPVPQPIVGPAHSKRVALLAFVQILDRPLVRQMRPDARQRHGESRLAW